MSWIKRILGGSKPPPPDLDTPDGLRDVLMAAVDRRDAQGLIALCKEHQERIVEWVPQWRTVPEEQRKDPAQVQRWGTFLTNLAQVFGQVLGDDRVIRTLSEGSPQAVWAKHREEAVRLVQEGEVQEAEALLRSDLEHMDRMWGEQVIASERELTLGVLGQLLAYAGQDERALPIVEEVLVIIGQREAPTERRIYLQQACSCLRRLGRGAEAMERSGALADLFEAEGQDREAARLRHLTRQHPQGLPLLRMARRIQGELWEEDEDLQVELQEGARIEFVFLRNAETVPLAARWTAQGEELAESGQAEDALERFEAAAKLDPRDPESRYLAAFTYALLGEFEQALHLTREVERLAPGWYENRFWLHTLPRLLAGELPGALVHTLHVLQDGPVPPEEKTLLASHALRDHPRVARLHLLQGKSLLATGERSAARQAFRAGLEVVGDDGDTATRLLVELSLLAEPTERIPLLAAVFGRDDGNLMARTAARFALQEEEGVGEC